MSGDLALVSPFNPEAPFVVGNAMARNKYLYCLAHDAIVVSSTCDRGGTWNGAVENLKRGWVPLWVKRTEVEDSGNPKLVELGGRWLQGLDDSVFGANSRGGDSGSTLSQPDATAAKPLGAGKARPPAEAEDETADPAQALYQKVRSLVATICVEPKQAAAIADALGVTKPTADAWIRRLVEERVLDKVAKPVRYVAREKDLVERIEGPRADH